MKNTKQTQQLDLFYTDKNNDIVKIDNRVIMENFANFSKGWGAFDLDWWALVTGQPVGYEDHLIGVPVEGAREIFLKNRNSHESLKDFVIRSNKTLKKFLKIVLEFESEDKENLSIMSANLFDVCYIDTSFRILLKVNSVSVPAFNRLKNWTRFSLSTLTSLHTVYSKRLFIYLKQWRTVGKVSFSIEEFRDIFDVPKSYKPGSIDQKILQPAMEDLAPYFYQLRLEKTYAKGRRGRKLGGYIFTFRPEPKEKKEIGVSKKMEDFFAIYSILNNRYLGLDHKFRAVDRYRNNRLGTTKKYYEKMHPQTFFIDTKNKGKSKYSLSFLNTQTITSLQNLAKTYEDLLKFGKLKEWDFDDLFKIEKVLFAKQVNLILETAESKDPYKISENTNTIAAKLIRKINVNKFDQDTIDTEIMVMIHKNYGSFIQVEDHRSPEAKILSK